MLIGILLLICFILSLPYLLPLLHRWKHETNGTVISGPTPPFYFGHVFQLFEKPISFGLSMVKQFGSLYQIFFYWQPVLVIADRNAAQQFYKHQFSFDKPQNFGLGFQLEMILGECLGLWSGPKYQRKHAVFTRCFQYSQVNQATEHIAHTVRNWVDHYLKSGEKVVCKDNSIFHIPLEIVATMIYGRMEDKQMKELKHLFQLHEDITRDIFQDKISKLPYFKYFPSRIKKKISLFNEKWRRFNRNMMEHAPDDAPIVHLKSLIGDSFSEKEILHTLDEIILTNLDVTGAGLGWALTHAAANPNVQEKLFTDIQHYLLPNLEDYASYLEYIDNQDTYLSHYMNEVFRYQPLVALTFPEKTHKDLIINGYRIPKNTWVSVDYLALHFADTWRTPEQFFPERWSNLSQAKVRYDFNRFGMGPRKCPGKILSDRILKVLVIETLSRYSLSIRKDSSYGIDMSSCIMPDRPFLTPNIPLKFKERQFGCDHIFGKNFQVDRRSKRDMLHEIAECGQDFTELRQEFYSLCNGDTKQIVFDPVVGECNCQNRAMMMAELVEHYQNGEHMAALDDLIQRMIDQSESIQKASPQQHQNWLREKTCSDDLIQQFSIPGAIHHHKKFWDISSHHLNLRFLYYSHMLTHYKNKSKSGKMKNYLCRASVEYLLSISLDKSILINNLQRHDRMVSVPVFYSAMEIYQRLENMNIPLLILSPPHQNRVYHFIKKRSSVQLIQDLPWSKLNSNIAVVILTQHRDPFPPDIDRCSSDELERRLYREYFSFFARHPQFPSAFGKSQMKLMSDDHPRFSMYEQYLQKGSLGVESKIVYEHMFCGSIHWLKDWFNRLNHKNQSLLK